MWGPDLPSGAAPRGRQGRRAASRAHGAGAGRPAGPVAASDVSDADLAGPPAVSAGRPAFPAHWAARAAVRDCNAGESGRAPGHGRPPLLPPVFAHTTRRVGLPAPRRRPMCIGNRGHATGDSGDLSSPNDSAGSNQAKIQQGRIIPKFYV